MIGLTFEASKKSFFDREAVMKATSDANLRNLSKFGAFVRQRAISLLLGHYVRSFGLKTKVRNRKGTSAPGQPPFAHTGLIPRFLFFAFDKASLSVVIGPVRVGGLSGAALPALEYGGPSDVWDGRARRRVTRTVRARPFMGPAFRAELNQIDPLWRDSVR